MTSNSKEIKALIANMTAEEKAVNIGALTYIKTLASNANVNIIDWDLLSIFGKEDGFNLISDKKILNKLFFDNLALIKSKPKTVAPTEQTVTVKALEVDAIKNAFITASKKIREAEIQTLNQRKRDYFSAVERLQRDLDTASKQYIEVTNKISAFAEVKDVDTKYQTALNEIQKVIDEEIWINPVFENGFLYLNTNTNIMLHEVKKSANLDLHIDLGQLAVRINITNNMYFSVIPYKNNISVDGYFHPHIQPEGGICWGEAQTTALTHIGNLELGKALRLLHSLLHSYNSASPYRALGSFKEAGRVTRVSDGLKHPDKRKEPKKEVTVTLPINPTPVNAVPPNAGNLPIGLGSNSQGNIQF